MAEKKKIVKYRRPLNLNIGVVFFFIIFIYIVFNVYTYFTTEHISVYEVSQGTIAENNNYHGFIIRSEKVCNSDYSGYVDYYLSDDAKAGAGNLIYSVDENGDVAKKMQDADNASIDLSNDDYSILRNTISSFAGSYQTNDFSTVYSFKEDLSSRLMQAVNENALDSLGDYVANAQNNQTFHFVTTPEDGIVTYYTDGYESVTVDSFDPGMLQPLDYTKNNLKQNTSVQAGDAVYKLITSENWQIVLGVSDKLYERLKDSSVVQIKFRKDDTTCWVNFTWKQIGDSYYMVLDLNNNLIRFANERYVEVELLLDEKSGLKIPNSAITKKEFFTIPKGYFTKGGDSNAKGLLVSQTDKNGTEATTFVETELFYESEDFYYIDEDTIADGTVIKMPDSSQTYTVGATDKLLGVYNVNKGYAVFKQVDILFQNEEYSIVRTGTAYGISLYDHIALKGDSIQEDDVLQ